MHEAQMHKRTCFLTLTYNREHLPADRSLNIVHWQNFMKRLRARVAPSGYVHDLVIPPKLPRGKVRFLQCGEYGDPAPATPNGRPHHHALLFGVDFFESRQFLTNSRDNRLYRCDTLDAIWSHGYCQIGTLTFKSAAYVARYCLKKHTGDKAWQTYSERVDQTSGQVEHYRTPPFVTMSRRPGIGTPWLDKFISDVYPNDEVIVNGKTTRPPRFYDYVLSNTDPLGLERIKKKRRITGKKHSKNNTPDRLRVREEILDRKLKRLPRNKNN